MERIVADNWSILVSAPVAFVAALCLGAIAGWIVVGLIYNQRLTHYQELIVNYQNVLEEKLPARALRPFPIKRSKQMSLGLLFILGGVTSVLLGAIIVSLDRSPPPSASADSTKNSVATNAPPPVPPVPPVNLANAEPEARDFIYQTPQYLMALYNGRTPLQADPLISPFKGKWIKAQGKIVTLFRMGCLAPLSRCSAIKTKLLSAASVHGGDLKF
jgi:hypothetical protein